MDGSPMMNSQIEERQAPSFFQKHKFTLISVAILIAALIPLVVLTQMHKKTPSPSEQAMMHMSPTVTPMPTTAPITQQNVQPTLDATDQQIQSALDASQTEINAAGQVDTSKDSTTGL